jgi:O-methyltransferase
MPSQLTLRLAQAASRPAHSLHLAPKLIAQALTRFFPRTAFYWQGQMDIHPKSRWYNRTFVERFGGFLPATENPATRRILDIEPWDCVRRDMLILLLRGVEERQVPGEFAELGVYQGSTARLIHHYAPARRLHLFDTFEGFDTADIGSEHRSTGLRASKARFANTSLEAVLRRIDGAPDAIHPHQGRFPESIPGVLNEARFAFVHLDADLYAPTLAGLTFFYPRLSRGAVLVIHDYNAWPGARQAVDSFFTDKPESPIPMPDKSGSAVIVKL